MYVCAAQFSAERLGITMMVALLGLGFVLLRIPVCCILGAFKHSQEIKVHSVQSKA